MALYALARLTSRCAPASGRSGRPRASAVARRGVAAAAVGRGAVSAPEAAAADVDRAGLPAARRAHQAARRASRDADGASSLPADATGASTSGGARASRAGPARTSGAATILLIAFGVWSRRWRLPSLAFAACGFVGWALNQDRLIRLAPAHAGCCTRQLGELWLRDPYRFRYLLIPAFAALGAYGLQAWLDAWSGRRPADPAGATVAWLGGGSVVVFVVAPLVAGADVGELRPVRARRACRRAALLWLVTRRTAWAAAALPALLAVELTVTALAGQAGTPLGGAAELSQARARSSGAGPGVRRPTTRPGSSPRRT